MKVNEPQPISHLVWHLNSRKIRAQTITKIIKIWT